MTAARVSELYDCLHKFEASFRRGLSYPMHKALQARADHAPLNVYDWIIDRIQIPQDGRILDAGCGVGFGTLRLAQRTRSIVTGISVSAREVEQARDAALRLGIPDRARFMVRSFDAAPRDTYRLVVAVESLKHSPNLARTLRVLRDSLVGGGQLVVVDDMSTVESAGRSARIMATDWDLVRVYSEDDYRRALAPLECRSVELSRHLQSPGRLLLAAQLGLLGLVMPLASASTARALRAFRGGLHLQRLYARKSMAYRAIFCTKPAVG